MTDLSTAPPSTLERLVKAVFSRLRDTLNVPADSILLDDDPWPVALPPHGGRCVTVVFGGCQTDEAVWAGAGVNGLLQRANLTVTFWKRAESLVPAKTGLEWIAPQDGLAFWDQRIMRAMLVGWTPADERGRIVTSDVQPLDSHVQRMRDESGNLWAGVSRSFGVEFDYGLDL